MNRGFLSLVFALAAMSVAPSPAAHAAKLWEREWREIKTEHFVIASALPR